MCLVLSISVLYSSEKVPFYSALVARQGRSDAQAGALLARAGPGLGDYARHLAYLLYEVANAAGRTEDAVAYNSLIVSWNNILQHARDAAGPAQQTLHS